MDMFHYFFQILFYKIKFLRNDWSINGFFKLIIYYIYIYINGASEKMFMDYIRNMTSHYVIKF